MKNIKQLTEFSNWIDNTINSVIVEKQEPKDDRSVERQRDITYLAKQKYPDYPAAQAIELYLADKLTDIEQRDAEQNRIINLQRRENQQLRTNMSSLRKELDDVEASGKEVDAEIERLKQLSGKIQTDVQQRRASTREVDELLKQVEQLKNKPGISSEQYDDIKKKVEAFDKQKINPEELKNFEGKLSDLADRDAVSDEQLKSLKNTVAAVSQQQEKILKSPEIISQNIQDIISRQDQIKDIAQDIETKSAELEKNKQAVDDVFRKFGEKQDDLSRIQSMLQSLKSKEQEIAQTKQIIDQAEKELQQKEQDFKINVQKAAAEEASKLKDKAQKYRKAVQARSKQASTKVNALVGKETPISRIKQVGDELQKFPERSKNFFGRFTDEDLPVAAELITQIPAAFDIIDDIKSTLSQKSSQPKTISLPPSGKSNPEFITKQIDDDDKTNIKEDIAKVDQDVFRITNRILEILKNFSDYPINKYPEDIVKDVIIEHVSDIIDTYEFKRLSPNDEKNISLNDRRFIDENLNKILPVILDEVRLRFIKRSRRAKFKHPDPTVSAALKDLNMAIRKAIGSKVSKWIGDDE